MTCILVAAVLINRSSVEVRFIFVQVVSAQVLFLGMLCVIYTVLRTDKWRNFDVSGVQGYWR